MFVPPNRAAKGRLSLWVLCVLGIVGYLPWAAGWKLQRWSPDQRPGFPEPSGYPHGFLNHRSASSSGTPEGEMCAWVPAGAATNRIWPGLQTAPAGALSSNEGVSVNADRAPVRVIHDPYPTYSAVAVDPIRDEIVAQDENLFQIMVFDRLANTPPKAGFTEPKRVIAGSATTLSFECGIYVDPKTGDIYSVANDVGTRVAVFSRQAHGNMAPARVFRTPPRTYGIAVDEERQEIFLSSEAGLVVVYSKMAQGEDKPLRRLEGPHTGLADTHGIAIDTKRNVMFLANHGNVPAKGSAGGRIEPPSITVYPLQASGDTPPIRVLQGPKTQLNWPALIYADVEHEELFVANDGDDAILVFGENDAGDIAPRRILKGPKTNLKAPSGVYVDTKNDELVVSNMGNHSVNVYARTASGDAAPKRVIRSAPAGKVALTIVNPGAVGYDSKRDELLVPN